MKNRFKTGKNPIYGMIMLLFLSIGAFAQRKEKDTLIINTKAGKIILVSDSLQNFEAVGTDVLIRKSLNSIKDSLAETIAQRKKRLWKEQYTYIIPEKHALRVLPAFGIGTITDKVSPFLSLSLDFGPQRQDYYFKSGGSYSFLNLAANGFFTFTKDLQDHYDTDKNIFLELSVGNRLNNFQDNFGRFSEAAFGIGYLAYKEGPYFERNTFKFFVSVGLYKSFVKIKPELYFTDNFNKIFPGITLKLF
jgi:hypothetical protein